MGDNKRDEENSVAGYARPLRTNVWFWFSILLCLIGVVGRLIDGDPWFPIFTAAITGFFLLGFFARLVRNFREGFNDPR